MLCVDVVTDVKLPVQEVLVAADVLQQSEDPCAGPSEELLAGPWAPPADRQPDDNHQQQETSTSQQAAAISPMTTVDEQPELGLTLQQAAERHSVAPDQAASQQTSESEPGSSEASQTGPHDSTVAVQQAVNTSSMSAAPQRCQTESTTEQASASETAASLSVRQVDGSPGLQQAADAHEGPSAHHDTEGSDSSQQALPSSQASKPSAASHVNSSSAQPEAEHNQQSALTADPEGGAAPDREPVSAEESCISEDVEVVLTPSSASEGHHAPPNTSNAEDGLKETSKVALEGVTTSSSASSKPAASPPVEEEQPTGAVVSADSSQAGAGPDSSVKAPNSPLGLQAIDSLCMPAKSGQPGAVSSSPIEGPNSPQGMQYSDTPATSQVAFLKAQGIAQALTTTGRVPTAAAVPTTAGPNITSTADLELITDEVAAGTDTAAAETTTNLPPAIGHASQNAPAATACFTVKDVAAADTTIDMPPAIAGASQDLHPSATKTTAGPPSESSVATANVLPDPASAGMHLTAPDARAAPNSPVVLPDSAVSTAEGTAGCSGDRAAADDLDVGAEADSVLAAPAAKSKSKLKSKSKPKSKARAALEDPAADAEGDMIAAKHPADQAGTSGNASTKPKTKKRSAKTKVSTQSKSASTATFDSADATATGSAVRESAHATAAASDAAEAAAVPGSASSTAPVGVAAADAAGPVQSGVEGRADSKYEVVPGDQRLERLKDPKARKLSSGATAVVYR